MKYRESGMPNEQVWNSFFDPKQILRDLEINKDIDVLLDIGCGYGTFLIPASTLVKNQVIGIDIETEMIKASKRKVQEQGIENVTLLLGDVATEQVQNELKKFDGKIDYICLFNILHCEEPTNLLKSVFELLNDNGKIGVIHWKYEDTPRGPSMQIRPTPEAITEWASKTGFVLEKKIDLPPYHYGLVFKKT